MSLLTSSKRRLRRLLLFLQRHTRTDMVSLTRNSFWTMSNYIILVAAGVVTTVAFANLLPKDVFGTYQFILSIASIVGVITLSGMKKAIIRAVAQGNDGAFRSGVRQKLKWNIGIVVASGVVAAYYFLNAHNELGIAFLIVGTFVPLIEGFKLYQAFLVGKEAFRDTVLLGAWRKPLPLIAVLVTVYLSDNLLLLVFIYFASNAFAYILLYFMVIRKYRPPLTNDTETLNYSKHLSVLHISSTITSNLDKILVWHLLGAAPVAALTIAQLATRYSGGILNTLSQQVLPRVSRRDLPTLQKTLPYKVRLFMLVMAIGAGVYILVVPFAFPLFFPAYPESVPVAQVLALGLILMPRTAYAQALTAHKLIRAQYIAGICMPLIKLALLYFLLPLYGLWGAAYAILASRLIGSAFTTYLFAKAKSPEDRAPITH